MNLQRLQEAIDENTGIDKELEELDNALNDEQVLSIAHQIKAKRLIRNDVQFGIMQALKEMGEYGD